LELLVQNILNEAPMNVDKLDKFGIIINHATPERSRVPDQSLSKRRNKLVRPIQKENNEGQAVEEGEPVPQVIDLSAEDRQAGTIRLITPQERKKKPKKSLWGAKNEDIKIGGFSYNKFLHTKRRWSNLPQLEPSQPPTKKRKTGKREKGVKPQTESWVPSKSDPSPTIATLAFVEPGGPQRIKTFSLSQPTGLQPANLSKPLFVQIEEPAGSQDVREQNEHDGSSETTRWRPARSDGMQTRRRPSSSPPGTPRRPACGNLGRKEGRRTLAYPSSLASWNSMTGASQHPPYPAPGQRVRNNDPGEWSPPRPPQSKQ
jgi:hypothetical protein